MILVMHRKIPMLVLVGSSLLGLNSCSSNSGADVSDDSFPSAMNAYSHKLIAITNSSISNPTVPEQTTDMPSFIVKYTVMNKSLNTKSDGDKNIVSYAINTGITEAWGRAFCTDELKEIMSKYGVEMVTGQLISKSGAYESMSACTK
jgi:hypothetical protein